MKEPLPTSLPADVIPFNRACLTGRELEYVTEAITRGPLSGDGPFTARCHALISPAAVGRSRRAAPTLIVTPSRSKNSSSGITYFLVIAK